MLKYCTQYVSTFGKLSSGHRVRKGWFSFQPQRKAMPKNVPTAIQLHSFYMLARLCSKSFKLCFNSTWTKNFQMYKLDLEKAEEPEIKLPTFVGSWTKQGNSKTTSTSASLTMLKHLTLCVCMCVCVCVCVIVSHVWLLATPWDAVHQVPPSTGFCRQEYWSGFPFPSQLWLCGSQQNMENS